MKTIFENAMEIVRQKSFHHNLLGLHPPINIRSTQEYMTLNEFSRYMHHQENIIKNILKHHCDEVL